MRNEKGQFLKGNKHSDAWFCRMRGSKFNLGNKHCLGHKHSEASKEKMRIAALRTRALLPQEVIRKTLLNLDQTGRKQTEEHKRKISVSHRGEKAPNWKGGISKLNLVIRGCFRYRIWRNDVFARDHFICVSCGYSKGGILEADHIIRFSEILSKYNIKNLEEALVCEPLWDINNGRTLCKFCHHKTKTFGKRFIGTSPNGA